MKNRNIFNLLLFMFVGLSLVSCDKGGDPDPGATKVVDMAGDWFVKFMFDGENVYEGYEMITTYNTAANDGQYMWVDDNYPDGNWIYGFKVKTPVDAKANTFSGNDLQNQIYDITVNITNGEVLKDAATTTGGNTTDSIHMNIEFSDDPGKIYTIAGYRRTGLLEDEH